MDVIQPKTDDAVAAEMARLRIIDERVEKFVCRNCKSDDGWVWVDRFVVYPNDLKPHRCRCGGNSLAVSVEDRSFFRNEMPIFFSRPSSSISLEDLYCVEEPMNYLEKTDCLCDYPNCDNRVPTMSYNGQNIIVFVYMKGSCSMQLSDDGDRWLRMDFCEDHVKHGEYFFIVSDARDQARSGDRHIIDFQQRILAQQDGK